MKYFSGAIDAVLGELERARLSHAPFNSAHEGFAVIEEEFLELRAEVFLKKKYRSKERMAKEATHLAAMAIRFLVDVVG